MVMADSGDELLSRAVSGDQGALTALLEQCGPRVRGRLEGKIAAQWRSALDVDDVMQVTYLEAFLHIERFEPSGMGSFVAWLTRIAENNLRDAVKELGRAKRPQPKNRVRAPVGDDSYVALCELLGATSTTPSRHAARGEVRRVLESALGELPEDYAKVIRLYDLEGRSAAEVAGAMGRSTGAVYMLRARALDRLRDGLGPESAFFTHAP